MNLISKIYVLCDADGNIRLYNINEKICVFIVPYSMWDLNGWKHVDGFSFKEKLSVLKLSTSVFWRKIGFVELLWIAVKYKAFNPMQLTIKIQKGKMKMCINEHGSDAIIYLCTDVVL
jgi:hypothetical protein